MSNYYSKTIYSNKNFNIIKRDGAIIIESKVDNNLIISSWLNAGYQENMTHIVNQSIEGNDYNDIEHKGYIEFQKNYMKHLGLNPETSTGLITSACMDNYAISTKTYKELQVTTIVTAGADKNGVKAGDPASFYEYNNKYYLDIGTINIITIVNCNLEPGALVTGIITATEAKTSILEDLKLESQYSTNIATGTGTDGICIISNKSSDNHIENAGKHSKLGELIAKSVQEATRKALYLQTAMSTEYQKTILSRLSRFNIYFDTLFDKTENISRTEYATLFYEFNNNSEKIALISCLINLIDEVQVGLLELNDIKVPATQLFNTLFNKESDYTFNSIDDIFDCLISSINNYIIKK
ncbi:MAG: adenosylcobinamide amidohydrolase [Methanosphaera sp.]|nr:adenosylcobinamide amidohydrolase [Methanosphaera sp.]